MFSAYHVVSYETEIGYRKLEIITGAKDGYRLFSCPDPWAKEFMGCPSLSLPSSG